MNDPNIVLHLPLWKKDGATFMSDDAYGHLATVTGATWGIMGRTFNGTSDSIITAASSIFSITEAITILVWFNPSTVTASTKTLFCLVGAGNDGAIINVNQAEGGGAEAGSVCFNFYDTDWRLTGATSMLVAGTFVCIGVTYDKANAIMYKNGVVVRTKAFTTSMVQVASPTVKIGRHADAGLFCAGTIGDVLIANRAYSAPEVMNFYLPTKWRYL